MALVAHYDLELHQMDVKTTFLNGDLYENVYMAQPKGFVVEGKENLGCRLKKSIYGLKQVSRQWYLKIDETIRKFGFKENEEDNCIYAKFKNVKFIFLILYVDDILLAGSDVDLLRETKKFLSSKFDMKDLGEASFILGIEIHRDRRNGVLALSQKAYLKDIKEIWYAYEQIHTHSNSQGRQFQETSVSQEQVRARTNEGSALCFSCRKLTVCTSVHMP